MVIFKLLIATILFTLLSAEEINNSVKKCDKAYDKCERKCEKSNKIEYTLNKCIDKCEDLYGECTDPFDEEESETDFD